MSHAPARHASSQPRIYYLNPLALIGVDAWREAFDHAASLGFNVVLSAPLFLRGPRGTVFSSGDLDRIDPALNLGDDADRALASLVEEAGARSLDLYLDLSIDHGERRQNGTPPTLDPRLGPLSPSIARNEEAHAAIARLALWTDRLASMIAIGVAGFRCLGLEAVSPAGWQTLIKAGRARNPQARFYAYTPGTDFALRDRLREARFDGSFSSCAWWDLKESWFLREYTLQQRLGSQIAFPEAPFGRRLAHGTEGREVLERRAKRALELAAWLGDGLLVPAGFEFGASLPLDPTWGDGAGIRGLRTDCAFDLSARIRSVNGEIAASERLMSQGLRISADIVNTVTVFARSEPADLRQADCLDLAIVNRDLRRPSTLPRQAIADMAASFKLDDDGSQPLLQPGEVRRLSAHRSAPILTPQDAPSIETAVASSRLAIEKISPRVDDGRFPVKRTVGDTITVEADIFADGHDLLAAALLFKARDEDNWREAPMSLVENDRWRATFIVDRIGRYEFCVEAWKNPFAIFRYELSKKNEARLDLKLELIEGAALVEMASKTPADTMPDAARKALETLLQDLKNADEPGKIGLLLSPRASELMALADRRPFKVRSAASAVDAERKEAGFASWYQIFPRSQSGDPKRHGTFDDVIARLPAIREMGFDVLYFPPIHPIGTTNRKGRNNSLIAATDDPGSPYAIGSKAGGHEAIHPELGDFEDFSRLVAAAEEAGLELALDLAIQASPDHPWLREHPGWFDWRPDGTIRYAENPPKKYEDIVNVDFYANDAVPTLWVALRDIVEGWVNRGVKLFRVDNPHTKPLPFWEWMIGDVRARHPEVVFLSEAFTRPKVMYRLAKVGFSQSYTYFTWRNSKWEIETYMRELTSDEPKDFFRPHFFVNTHDINPDFLQNAPRRAYLIRAALAATLSGLWGVYNGFELCEGRPDAKRKEYADSEKYEIRAWDYDRPGHIKAEIAMLNRIRRDNAALHSHLGLTLLNTTSDQVIFFEKAASGRHNTLLVAISLDPERFQQCDIELPLWHFGLDDGATISLEDLIGGDRFKLTGKWQRIAFDPNNLPFAIWRVRTGEV